MNDKKVIWVLDTPLHQVVLDMQSWKLKKLVAEGSQVDVVICGTSVGACVLNPLGLKKICSYCKSKAKIAMSKIEVNLIDIDELPLSVARENARERSKLNGYVWNVESVFVSKFRIHLTDKTSRVLKHSYTKLHLAYHSMLESLRTIVRERKYNEVWTFNERGINCGAAIECAKQEGLPYGAFELCGRDYKVTVAYNSSVFTSQFWSIEYRKLISSTSRKQVMQGKAFFEAKLRGEWTNDRVYQTPKAVPVDLQNLGLVDVLFLYSSEDEFAALGESWKRFFSSQEEVCVFVKKNFPGWNIAVRFHPNQAGIPKNTLKEKISLLKQNGIRVFEPKSEISSYELLSNAKVIVTFGSTIAIEAVYQGRKVVQVDKYLYSDLRIISQANSYTELLEFLNNPSKITKKRFRALGMGYCWLNYTSEECDQAYVTEHFLNPKPVELSLYGRVYFKVVLLVELFLSDRPLNLQEKTRKVVERSWRSLWSK